MPPLGYNCYAVSHGQGELKAPMKRSIHFPFMLLLSALFVLRVAAQLVQAVHEVSFLPPFDAWQGSATPYPMLLGAQVVIMAILAVVLWCMKAGIISPRPWKYWACFVLGGIYFLVMAFRFVAGLTFLSEIQWFASVLPTLFHIVLASLILIFGHYLYTLGKQAGKHSA